MTQNHLQHILLRSNCALLLFQITVFWTSLLLSNVSFFWKPADRNLNRDMQRSFEMSGWCPSPIVLCSVSNGLILRWKVHRSPPEMEEEKKTVLLLRLRRLLLQTKPHSTKQPERSGRGRDTNQHWITQKTCDACFTPGVILISDVTRCFHHVTEEKHLVWHHCTGCGQHLHKNDQFLLCVIEDDQYVLKCWYLII